MSTTTASTPSSRLDWLLFVILGGMWGSSYLFIKFGVDEGLTPFTLIALRLGIGLALLVAVVALAREPLPRDRRIYGHLVVMSVVNIVLPFFLITSAERTVDSALASIINATVPLFAIVIAAFVLQDEPLTVNRLAGLGLGFVGVIVLTGGSIGVGGDLGGQLALLGSAVSYGAGAVYSRRNMRGIRPMIPALFQVGFAFVISAVLAFATERPLSMAMTPKAIFSVIWLGILGSGVAYLVNFRLLARWGATRTSMVAYLLPVFGITLGVTLGAETISVAVIVGTLLVVGGVALANSKIGNRTLYGRSPRVQAR
ncbi:MAG TPA: DMT family transporter [Candidatus Limnocylindrales bacterium]|nr:DMT family transporter [Candidatus Limnocylindrales bacterium]